MISKPTIILSGLLFCAIVCSAYAEQIVTGGGVPKPNSTFETQHMSAAPNYRSSNAWAALPGKKSGAYLAPANTKYPESQATAAADVFFIHPTTSTSVQDNWNLPIDDPDTGKDLDNILGFSASIFNAAAKVYAPRYRQANLCAFFDDKAPSSIKALDFAYHDVERAFLYYIKFYNHGRPFILAGHSQGSVHGLRLLQEHIVGTPLKDRLVAAYLIGGTIPAKTPSISLSHSATDTGVLIGWNTYAKEGDPSFFTNGMVAWVNGAYVKNNNKPLVETNPLSWQLNGGKVSASQNPGSLPTVLHREGLKGVFSLIPAVCGADASKRVLIINKSKVPGFYLSAEDTPVFNTQNGDYHCFDYTLFYESIRKNAIDRVRAFSCR